LVEGVASRTWRMALSTAPASYDNVIDKFRA